MKRNGIILLIMILTAVIGVGGLLIGYWLSGHDILVWFGSKWAITIYIAVGLTLVLGGSVLIKDAISKL